ncbi:ATP-binding protein [Xylanibacter rodentium]|jgi:DNA polymerase-3 subunit delta'|uniref:AAA family ATPase n=2 Tax=Xylanibacter rodentium TaxID=2736289 RepID=A0ABX2AWE2_9BACT|nr:AAA family ATPase [Xylanibacter rodentium]NPE12613.1 AAA family ATPase [Prevotella sp. PJ1A]NPE15104.1 AAA family ATPase [Xylanibacter rodentium]NPE40043.1 AAA family ATPase [Prevotella sp. PCJ2]
MKFNDVIGQKEAKQRLMQMYGENRLPHAIMLCGPSGCGKMALALAFACHILRGGTEEDGKGEAMLAKMEHPDLHFTYPTIKRPGMGSDHKPVSGDFAAEWHSMIMQSPYFTMDRWMRAIGAENQQAIITAGESDELTRKLSLKSSQGGYKISVIWLPERMNIECANKLLKMIEEPPSHTLFIMVCNEPEKLLETIRSRTQTVRVRKIDEESIRKALIERRSISEDAAGRIARMANGDWTKAVELTETGSENDLFLDMFQSLMRLAYMRRIKDLKRWSETMQGLGREKQKRFLEYFLRLIRENFMYNFQCPELTYMSQREEDFAHNFARFVNENNIIPINELANRAIRDIGQNANGKIVFFDMALQMIVLLMQNDSNR